MPRFNIPSCRNWEFRNTAVSLSQFLLASLSLCACTDVVQLHDGIAPLIHNGVTSKPGKWSWHALLLTGSDLCGGTFVDSSTILTAAHCVVIGDSVRRENDILVFGGRKYRDEPNKDQQEFNLARIIIHPQYNFSTLANDIAILKLTSDINITNFVRPVPIWNTDIDESQIFGLQGTVIGFGLNEDDEPSDTLQQAKIPVLDTQQCRAFDNVTYGKYLTTKMYCAGGKDNVSACNGDSGGGMFFNLRNTWYLRGLVSFSPARPKVNLSSYEEQDTENIDENIRLCDSSKPTVFTDVTKYRNWILRYTNTTKWLKELKPCKDGAIEIDTECKAANRFDSGFLSSELSLDENVSFRRFSVKGDQPFNGHEVLAVIGIYSIAKDCVDGRFYWTESGKKSIFSAKYNQMVKKAFPTERHRIGDVAVDWISRRIYWVDVDKKTIKVASLDNPGLRTTVMINVSGYSRIAVDPLQGKLYTMVRNRGIVRCNLDGSEPELMLENSGIERITVSIATGEICYINRNTFKIDCIDTRSKWIRTIVSNVTDAYDLVATDDLIYWLTPDSETIESVNRQGVRQKPLLYPNATENALLIVLTDVCPIIYSPCAKNNGGCAENTICLHNPRVQSGKICKSLFEFSNQTDPSKIIKSTLVKLVSYGEGKQRKWPWHVVIYNTLDKRFKCGGSIINMNTVLTAAHCLVQDTLEGLRVLPKNELSVSVGSDYVDGITDATQVLNVAQILIHPHYDQLSLANDIAIVKLSTDMNITNYVRPATVWNATSGRNELVGMNGTVVGFSLDEDGELSPKLRGANLNVIDTKTCLEYGHATYGKHLTSRMYCAYGYYNNNVCFGDGGGGMYFNINGTWYLGGIVSFGLPDTKSKSPACNRLKPTVFTDVTKYDKWILRHTNSSKWLKTLEPCKDGTIERDTECNAASLFDHDFLLTSQKGTLVRVPMNGEPSFNISDGIHAYDMDYDCVEGRLYWSDYETQSIYSAKYDGTDKKIFLSKDLGHPSYVAVDWISRRLYWVDKLKETFEVASLENPDLRLTLSNSSDGYDISIDPLQGRLYRKYPNQTTTSNLDGSEALRLLRSEPGDYYDDMKVSVATGELCYIVTSSRIECIDTRSKQILTIVNNLTETSVLAVTDERIYWTGSHNVIESISRDGVRQKPLMLNGSESDRRSLIAISDVCPVFYSPCAINNGDCPANTLCLLNPRVASGKICKCTQNCSPFGD